MDTNAGSSRMNQPPTLTRAEAIEAAERRAASSRRPYIVSGRHRVMLDTENNRTLIKNTGEGVIYTAPSASPGTSKAAA
jgi:hypothetical protein